MKMDTSKWISINPDVRFKKIQKKFYNRFTTKLVYKIKGARSLSYTRNHDDIEFHFRAKLPNPRNINAKQFQRLCYLKDLFDLISKIKKVARVRIESDRMSIFGDEGVLEELAHGSLAPFKHLLETVYLASNQIEQQLIDEGYILLRRPTDFQYRVHMRPGFYVKSNLKNFLEYANNVPEEIKMTDDLKFQLQLGHKYFNGNYFYIKDPKILDVIILIDPTLVKSYQKIKVIQ